MKKTMDDLHQKKRNAQKITMLTCYDYPTAVLQDQAGVDVIFAGDSLGPNELGYEREVSVTLDDIIHHLKAVRRALNTANMLLRSGADGVKLERLREEPNQPLRVVRFTQAHQISGQS